MPPTSRRPRNRQPELFARSKRSIIEIAPNHRDVSVFPREPRPETGRRQLEHLAFEIVSTQSLGEAGRKASLMAARGVRRVFAIDIERARMLEWSGTTQTWQPLVLSA